MCTIPLTVNLTAGGSRLPRGRYPLAFPGITVAAATTHELVADRWLYWLPVASHDSSHFCATARGVIL